MSALYTPVTSTKTVSASGGIQPYINNTLAQANAATSEGFKPYTGQLTAGLSPLEQQANKSAGLMQLAPQYTSAGNTLNTVIQGLLNTTGMQGGEFGSDSAAKYMSPYQQNVIDIAKREAGTDFEKQQAALRGRLGAAGAFGGSRATLLETEGQRNQNQLLSDIQSKGMQSAFENAQQQFERDRAARFTANTQNQQGLTAAGSGAQGLMQLGSAIGQDQRAIIGTQAALGQQERARQQAALDAQKSEWQREVDDPITKAAKMAAILGPILQSQTTTSTSETGGPTGLAQGLGLLSGLAGALGSAKGDSVLGQAVSTYGGKALDALGSAGSSAWTGISDAFGSAKDWFSNLWGDDTSFVAEGDYAD